MDRFVEIKIISGNATVTKLINVSTIAEIMPSRQLLICVIGTEVKKYVLEPSALMDLYNKLNTGDDE